jgi:hypothetical protein
MACFSFQKQGDGRHISVYATVARWGRLEERRARAGPGAALHRSAGWDGGGVWVSKGIVGTADVRLPLEELRRRVGESADVAEMRVWLGDR